MSFLIPFILSFILIPFDNVNAEDVRIYDNLGLLRAYSKVSKSVQVQVLLDKKNECQVVLQGVDNSQQKLNPEKCSEDLLVFKVSAGNWMLNLSGGISIIRVEISTET